MPNSVSCESSLVDYYTIIMEIDFKKVSKNLLQTQILVMAKINKSGINIVDVWFDLE